ncbi:hypothetical protein DL762_010620 [Monosporascus cannonballus]|uniref:Uncharacterized protein n=1 Tax=Monosporascus cannonballus TaxID=155416 RepID=A0ABY0GR30_9PEZI|nr:hypothetical protein DL762_010620 [Monosporascus cannonballus]
MLFRHGRILVALGLLASGVLCQDDNLGLNNGYITIDTANFNARIVRNAQVLASLTPKGKSFDFLPFDLLRARAANGQYHWGDITFRYREAGAGNWIDGDSASRRRAVTATATGDDVLAASIMAPTLPAGPLNVTREWLDASGDLGLRFTIRNSGSSAVEVGGLGFPAEFNSIFTNRRAPDMQRLCSLSDPYVGMHAGHIRVAPTKGTGPALVVTPLGDTPMEAYRNLAEPSYPGTYYGSQTFEGFYEWQVLTKAWAEKEWAGREPWNPPSARTLEPGESLQFGVRFSVAEGGVRELDATIRKTGTPVAVGVPGYIIPRDSPAQLFLQADSDVASIAAEPAGSLVVKETGALTYAVTPSAAAWGRARLTIEYADGKIQTVHYYITKPGPETLADLGRFFTTRAWFNDASDPFGRAPSPMTYDYEAGKIVEQDPRVWVAGLSDEGGTGAYLAAVVKQAIQPDAEEVAKLEEFVDRVLWGRLQREDYGVRKSLFFYEPAAVPGYRYDSGINWGSWTSWNKNAASLVDRAYNYVHPAAAYWSLYRVARAYPQLVKTHTWEWYLDHAYRTIIRGMERNVGYNRVGLMGETVFGEILADLEREGRTSQAGTLKEAMRSRAAQWDTEEVPFGSEMAWDSTGQEGVYYWTKYFGYTRTAAKSLNSVLGFMPTVPHWGWNGNARRYWDNIYGGKLRRIERQIHHYGSGLNSLVALAAYRDNPSDSYLMRVGYGGTSGPLSNINRDGFAAASFHSWPATLKWDGISGDYGPGFLGMVLGSGTYVVDDKDVGLVAYGGILETTPEGNVNVAPRDPTRKRVFIGPLGVAITIDAGVIDSFTYAGDSRAISVTLSQLPGAPKAASAVMWAETTGSNASYGPTSSAFRQARKGWQIPLTSDKSVNQNPGTNDYYYIWDHHSSIDAIRPSSNAIPAQVHHPLTYPDPIMSAKEAVNNAPTGRGGDDMSVTLDDLRVVVALLKHTYPAGKPWGNRGPNQVNWDAVASEAGLEGGKMARDRVQKVCKKRHLFKAKPPTVSVSTQTDDAADAPPPSQQQRDGAATGGPGRDHPAARQSSKRGGKKRGKKRGTDASTPSGGGADDNKDDEGKPPAAERSPSVRFYSDDEMEAYLRQRRRLARRTVSYSFEEGEYEDDDDA